MENQTCPNCGGSIALANFTIHEAYCTRSLVKCSLCSQLVRKTLLEKHLSEFHSTMQCDFCFESFERCDASKHREVCSMRSAACEFCDLVLPVFSMREHQEQCGCRTELCSRCGKYVMNKERSTHVCSSRLTFSDVSLSGGDNTDLDRDFDIALRLQCMELSGLGAQQNVITNPTRHIPHADTNGRGSAISSEVSITTHPNPGCTGDPLRVDRSLCLSRTGDLSELRPPAPVSSQPQKANFRTGVNVCNVTKPKSVQNRLSKRPAYDLPPVRDPRAPQRKSSLPVAGSSTRGPLRVNLGQVRSSPSSSSATTQQTYPRRRILHPNNPIRQTSASNLSATSCTNVSAPHFPGRGRRLGDF
ncbi:hypothetical protein D915_008518 [Fasciola hepatica]|uniref:TRAFD1/XAF1 zinc finger domain-containing protein n=1 Tax=Fasciola hepatica TaxID=6192 RepID=A0A4E0QYY7_FASHE|nr:hypothetical protein D915_008518 [Fasciola hepatica]